MTTDYVYHPQSEQDQLRWAGIQWLRERTFDGELPLTREEILDFRWRGEMFRLQDHTKGIRKPQGWSSALSVTTSYRARPEHAPYADSVGPDGLWRYKWEVGGPQKATNAGLRVAHEFQQPLIGFIGIGGSPTRFQVITPIRVMAWEPDDEQVILAPAEHGATLGERLENGSQIEQVLREYLVRETKVRVHQPFFRQLVLRAYENRCAICNLGHAELLDAAHIIPDAQGGEPVVTNGLALCKIHHTAYDRHFIGVDEAYTVHVRPSLLEETDGPMLEHGIKGLHGSSLRHVPRSRAERPDRSALAQSFQAFQDSA